MVLGENQNRLEENSQTMVRKYLNFGKCLQGGVLTTLIQQKCKSPKF